jgi:hypothetical protein
MTKKQSQFIFFFFIELKEYMYWISGKKKNQSYDQQSFSMQVAAARVKEEDFFHSASC